MLLFLVFPTRREINTVPQSGPLLTTGELLRPSRLSGEFEGKGYYNITFWENARIPPFRLRIHLDKDEGKEGGSGSTLLVKLKALVITFLMLTVVFVLLAIMIYLFSFLNWLRGSDLETLLRWLLVSNPFIQDNSQTTSVLAFFPSEDF